jgi:hypothetical protein
MTEGQLSHVQNEALRASFDAHQAVQTCRGRLALIGQKLHTIGFALMEHPEEVNPLPEPISSYDYRKEIEAIRDGEKAVTLCADLRNLIQQAKAADQRKAMLTTGPFFSRDSAAS